MNSIQGYHLFIETLKNGILKEIYEKLYVLNEKLCVLNEKLHLLEKKLYVLNIKLYVLGNELYRIRIKHIVEELNTKISMTIEKYKKNKKLYKNILAECKNIEWFLKRTIDEMWFKHLLSINHKNAKFVKNLLN